MGAIESLDNIQTHFDKEMQTVGRSAEHLGSTFTTYVDNFRDDVVAIENLTRLNRLLTDGLRQANGEVNTTEDSALQM